MQILAYETPHMYDVHVYKTNMRTWQNVTNAQNTLMWQSVINYEI